MEKKIKDLEEAVVEMAVMFRQYGYRNRFTITIPGSNRPKFIGNLNDCLNRYLAAAIKGDTNNIDGFELETRLPYNDRILCMFKMGFDPFSGFLIKQLEARDQLSNKRQVFHLWTNRDLPGIQKIEALFPKPKLWDIIRKGKLRP